MPEARPRVILAFDFGLRRIGVAVGDTITRTAGAKSALNANAHGPDWSSIERALASHKPDVLVVGRPLNVDGSPGRLSGATDRFAAELAARTRLPVARVDERWSSLEATQRLREARSHGTRGRLQRADIDSAAAAIILERWFAGEG